MIRTTFLDRRRLEALEAPLLVEHQLSRLNSLLAAILPRNEFYAEKLAAHVDLERLAQGHPPLASLDALSGLPFTYKEELQTPTTQGHLAANLTFPLEQYTRFH